MSETEENVKGRKAQKDAQKGDRAILTVRRPEDTSGVTSSAVSVIKHLSGNNLYNISLINLLI